MCKLVVVLAAAVALTSALSGCNGVATSDAHSVRNLDNFGGILKSAPPKRSESSHSARSMDNFGGIL